MGLPLIVIQQRVGLKPDGIFGKETLKTLSKLLNLNNEYAAHFFGQGSHESGNFQYDEENLNYSLNNLLTIFPNFFKTPQDAAPYANKAIQIANKVYANRMGNGDEASGDGWKYRGRGLIELTGKDNYRKFVNYIGEDVISNPDLVAKKYFLESGKFFFDTNKLWDLCKTVDKPSIIKLTKRINGGVNGLDQRIDLTLKYYNWLTT